MWNEIGIITCTREIREKLRRVFSARSYTTLIGALTDNFQTHTEDTRVRRMHDVTSRPDRPRNGLCNCDRRVAV